MVKELWRRHFVKMASWRIFATCLLAIIIYLNTGSLSAVGAIASIAVVLNSIAYVFHEKLWSHINWGRHIPETKGCLLWLTGLSGSGKTTVADEVSRQLKQRSIPAKRIDGDVARRTFSSDLGFSKKDRAENCRRAAQVGSYLKEDNVVLASFISPYESIRTHVREKGGIIIHVDCDIDECSRRDPKGMYSKLQDGKFKGSPFTGMHKDAPYELPVDPELTIKTSEESIKESAAGIISYLEANGYI